MTKDNFILCVQAVDTEGHASPAVYPRPASPRLGTEIVDGSAHSATVRRPARRKASSYFAGVARSHARGVIVGRLANGGAGSLDPAYNVPLLRPAREWSPALASNSEALMLVERAPDLEAVENGRSGL